MTIARLPAERFPIVSRRAARMKRVQTVQHLFAALLLASNGWQHLQHGEHLVLPALEIAAALLLVGAAVRERLRHVRGHGHDAIGWVEIAGGVMTLTEAIARTQERHHFLFYVLQFVPPLVLFVFGFFDVRIAAMRYLEANDERLVLRQRLLFRRSVRWEGTRGFRFRGKTLELEIGDRVRKLPMRDIENFEAAQAWVREEFRRRGVAEV